MRPEKFDEISGKPELVVENKRDALAIMIALELERRNNAVGQPIPNHLSAGIEDRVNLILSDDQFKEEHIPSDAAPTVIKSLRRLMLENSIFSPIAREAIDSYIQAHPATEKLRNENRL